MKDKILNRIIVILIVATWCTLALFSWCSPSKEISKSERRKLDQFPDITVQRLIRAEFMEDFEEYVKDQFPGRFLFRSIKGYVGFYPLGKKDSNGIYLNHGYAVKMEYPMNDILIKKNADQFRNLYEKYMKDKKMKAYLCIIPDKGYFLSEENGYPSMDYLKLFNIVKENTKFAKYIDISNILGIGDYYKTDIHWRQEQLIKVADKISSALGTEKEIAGRYTTIQAEEPFYGVYYGHSALPMKPDKLNYITNDMIGDCTVFNIETGKTTSVYDTEKLAGMDPYDVYLSGASALLIINNPNAKTEKELVIFRDSFASSLTPLLLDGYSKVTMIDLRYISGNQIGNYVSFDNQDVLFVYSTSILNSGSMLK